jgi:hypothetical protein
MYVVGRKCDRVKGENYNLSHSVVAIFSGEHGRAIQQSVASAGTVTYNTTGRMFTLPFTLHMSDLTVANSSRLTYLYINCDSYQAQPRLGALSSFCFDSKVNTDIAAMNAARAWIKLHPYQTSFHVLNSLIFIEPTTATVPIFFVLGFGGDGPRRGTYHYSSSSRASVRQADIIQLNLLQRP